MKMKIATLTMLALAACTTSSKAHYSSSSCQTQNIVSPDGACRAHYKQDWRSPSISTMLIAGCGEVGSMEFRGLTLYVGQPDRGMILHWVANDRLEVALPSGVTTGHPEHSPDGLSPVLPGSITDADLAPNRTVHLTYRDQTPADHAQSCYARRPKAN